MADDIDPRDVPDEEGGRLGVIVRRAHRRFKKCQVREATARDNWMMDYKFDCGDAYNNYQWPVEVYQDRGAKPSLTVNETHQHNLHIINDAKQNKAEVKYRPTGGGATAEAAEVYEGIYRHISNISNAQMAEGVAIEFQIKAGLGYTLIESDYIDVNPKPGPEAFNQEIYIRSVQDPMGVYLDCDCPEIDGTGARYGFVFTDRPKDEIIEKYPQLKGNLTIANGVDGADAGWIREDHVRQARYYEVTEDRDELLGDDEGTVVMASNVPPDLRKRWDAEEASGGTKLKRRSVIRKSVKSYLIIGNDLVEETDLPGTAVPIIPWVGEVTIVEQTLDRKGHTRCMIGAQQMENYNWSASVEYGALQNKIPYIAPVAAIGDYMTYWQTANTENHSVLPWVHRDEEGKDIPPPQRQQAPTSAPVYMEGVTLARQFMQAASGQHEADLGEQGNERSGKAINARQRQGERATYHFIDHQALAIRRQGVIIKEWIPVIYDTERVAKILGVDDEEAEVHIDPNAEVAHHLKKVGDAIMRVFNPRIGSYEVVSDVGPDYATQRQEAFNAIIQILTQAPELINRIGDLLFKVADFPLADEIAERLKPGMPPEAQHAIGLLQKQLQDGNRRLGEAMQALTEERLKVKAKDAAAVTDEFRADTERVKMLLDAAVKTDPAMARHMLLAMANEAVRQAGQDNLGPVRLAAGPDLAIDATGGNLPGATGAIPAPVPDLGQQAAQPGGM